MAEVEKQEDEFSRWPKRRRGRTGVRWAACDIVIADHSDPLNKHAHLKELLNQVAAAKPELHKHLATQPS